MNIILLYIDIVKKYLSQRYLIIHVNKYLLTQIKIPEPALSILWQTNFIFIIIIAIIIESKHLNCKWNLWFYWSLLTSCEGGGGLVLYPYI